MSRPAKFDGRLRKLMKFGEGMQPGTVEWELNKHRQCKEQRENEKQWAQLEPTHDDRDPRSLWEWIVRIFYRIRPE